MTRAARSRRWTIAAAVALFAAIFVLRLLDDVPADGVGFLYVLPVALVAVEWGWRWGMAAGAFACLLSLLWIAIAGVELSAIGYATRAFVLIATGGVLGRVAARIRAERRRDGPLLRDGQRHARDRERRRAVHTVEPRVGADAGLVAAGADVAAVRRLHPPRRPR